VKLGDRPAPFPRGIVQITSEQPTGLTLPPSARTKDQRCSWERKPSIAYITTHSNRVNWYQLSTVNSWKTQTIQDENPHDHRLIKMKKVENVILVYFIMREW